MFHAEILTLELALIVLADRKIKVGQILMECGEMVKALLNDLGHHN